MKARSFWALLIPLLFLAAARGGSEGDPEISDETGEVTLRPEYAGADVAVPEIDFVSTWFEPSSTHLSVVFKVLDLSHRTFPQEAFGLSLAFESADYDSAYVDANWYDLYGWEFLFMGFNGTSEPVTAFLNGTIDEARSIVKVDIPCALLPSDLSWTHVSSILMVPRPGGYTGQGQVWFRDAAPNHARGPGVALACV